MSEDMSDEEAAMWQDALEKAAFRQAAERDALGESVTAAATGLISWT